jgi:hypothetical protein
MIPQSFFDADGWTCHKQNGHILYPTATDLFQKREMAGNTTLFYWNVWYFPKDRIKGHELKEAYQLEARLKIEYGPFFEIQVSGIDSVEQLEDAMGRIRRFYAGEKWEAYDD